MFKKPKKELKIFLSLPANEEDNLKTPKLTLFPFEFFILYENIPLPEKSPAFPPFISGKSATEKFILPSLDESESESESESDSNNSDDESDSDSEEHNYALNSYDNRVELINIIDDYYFVPLEDLMDKASRQASKNMKNIVRALCNYYNKPEKETYFRQKQGNCIGTEGIDG